MRLCRSALVAVCSVTDAVAPVLCLSCLCRLTLSETNYNQSEQNRIKGHQAIAAAVENVSVKETATTKKGRKDKASVKGRPSKDEIQLAGDFRQLSSIKCVVWPYVHARVSVQCVHGWVGMASMLPWCMLPGRTHMHTPFLPSSLSLSLSLSLSACVSLCVCLSLCVSLSL